MPLCYIPSCYVYVRLIFDALIPFVYLSLNLTVFVNVTLQLISTAGRVILSSLLFWVYTLFIEGITKL